MEPSGNGHRNGLVNSDEAGARRRGHCQSLGMVSTTPTQRVQDPPSISNPPERDLIATLADLLSLHVPTILHTMADSPPITSADTAEYRLEPRPALLQLKRPDAKPTVVGKLARARHSGRPHRGDPWELELTEGEGLIVIADRGRRWYIV
jgi:hypothetical protein